MLQRIVSALKLAVALWQYTSTVLSVGGESCNVVLPFSMSSAPIALGCMRLCAQGEWLLSHTGEWVIHHWYCLIAAGKNMDADGASALAAALHRNASLTTLNVEDDVA